MAPTCPPMARGDHIWTQLFSEPDAGSDLTGLQTRGTRDGDDYVVVGQKVWSTWAQWSDYGYLLARTEPVDGAGGITAFIFDMHSPGVDVRPLREMTGTTDFNEVFFDEVRVPGANIIGGPGEGWKVAGASLAEERSGVGAGRRRRSRAPPRAPWPGATAGVAALPSKTAPCASRSATWRPGPASSATWANAWPRRRRGGRSPPADAPMAKIWFSELNLEIAETALALQGARSMAIEGDELSDEDGRWQDTFLYARA